MLKLPMGREGRTAVEYRPTKKLQELRLYFICYFLIDNLPSKIMFALNPG